jgi:hypothetical protein
VRCEFSKVFSGQQKTAPSCEGAVLSILRFRETGDQTIIKDYWLIE